MEELSGPSGFKVNRGTEEINVYGKLAVRGSWLNSMGMSPDRLRPIFKLMKRCLVRDLGLLKD